MDKLRDRQDEKPKGTDRKDHKVKDRERGKVITNKGERDRREMKLMEEKDGHRLKDGQEMKQNGLETKRGRKTGKEPQSEKWSSREGDRHKKIKETVK